MGQRMTDLENVCAVGLIAGIVTLTLLIIVVVYITLLKWAWHQITLWAESAGEDE